LIKWEATIVDPLPLLPRPVEEDASGSKDDADSWFVASPTGAPIPLAVSGKAGADEVLAVISSVEVDGTAEFPAETSGEDENAGGAGAFCVDCAFRSLPSRVVASPLCKEIRHQSFINIDSKSPPETVVQSPGSLHTRSFRQ
jgi:hypothetical protein